MHTSYDHSGNRVHAYEKRIGPEVIEEGDYWYDSNANIEWVDRTAYEGEDEWVRNTYLEYDKMGRLWRLREFESPPGGSTECITAWEFRYAGARRRYLTRQLDPVTLDPMADGDVWSDYLGDSIWGDYTVDDGTATMTARYVPGLWQTDLTPLGDEPPGVPTTAFVHTNMLGTTRMLSSDAGAAIFDASRLYTAFGVPAVEPASPMTRYGYAGAWGYQSNSALSTQHSGLLHVGARYYDPRIGRFLQRDPIGIHGGLNVYAYVWSSPTAWVDPEGYSAVGGVLLPAGGIAAADGPFPIGDAIAGALICGAAIADLYVYFTKPHTKNKRKSNLPKHEEGDARRQRDQGGEKGDARRKPNPNKRRSPRICFAEGTPVLTDDGLRSIEDVVWGDFVFSMDADTGTESCAQVTATFGDLRRANLRDRRDRPCVRHNQVYGRAPVLGAGARMGTGCGVMLSP